MSELAIQVEGLGKRFRLGVGAGGYDTLRYALARAIRHTENDERELWALRGVDLQVKQGETLGIVGSNGAGKSTLLRILSRITTPTEGIVRTRGVVGALLDVGTGMNWELTGRENVYIGGTVLGMRRQEIRTRFDEIVEFSGLERFLDTPIKRYSDGMRLRLAFAVAAHLEPPIVVVDEVLAVGDSAFREKCMGKIAEMGRRDRTVLLVSHDLGAITQMCTRAVWLSGGRIQSEGPARQIVSDYLQHAAPGGPLDIEYEPEPNAAVAIQRTTIRNTTTGDVLTGLDRGQPFVVTVRFVVREPIVDLNLGIRLIDELGVVIIDDTIRDRGTDAAMLGAAGSYEASLTIPPLLRVGSYGLHAWFGNSVDDFVDRELVTVRIAPRADDPHEFVARTRAIQPEIAWRLAREPT